jgi:2-polyprenyl-3-methyl-5-hydroxy-6-metoxy-1,4-benzoquinol methylase
VSHWETEYSNGKWAFMRDLPEVSRYSVIIGYITYFAHRGAVLDVGSGDGILRERLVQPLRRYVGVDISSEAIRHARRLEDAQTMFVCADVTQYDPDDTFDVIVFNEVLYYLNDPLSLLRRYERYVQPGGVFVISMHVNPKTTNNWQRLEAAYSFLDETSTTNTRSGHTWVCRVCQPLHREQPA